MATYFGPNPYIDVIKYINAVNKNGGSLSYTERNAINKLVLDFKKYGIWDKFIALYPLMGGSSESMSINAKNPGTFDMTWVNTVSGDFTTNGWTPNGSTSYGKTGINSLSDLTLNDVHVSYYFNGAETGGPSNSGVEWGALKTTPSGIFEGVIRYDDGGSFADQFLSDIYNGTTGRAQVTNSSDIPNFYIWSRTAQTVQESYKGGVSLVTSSGPASGNTPPDLEVFVGARMQNGSMAQPSDRRAALISFGTSMNDTDAANFNTSVATFQTALGRNI